MTARSAPLALIASIARAAPRLALATLLACAVLLAAPAPARADSARDDARLHAPLDALPQSTVSIESGGRSHAFRIWLAATPESREQGLMWIRKLAPDRGMLFLFDAPQLVSFWMKNTYISLDLLFVAPDGRVIRIAEHAKPLSLETIDSMGTVRGVLEVRAGTARRLGLKPGDRLVHPAFAAR